MFDVLKQTIVENEDTYHARSISGEVLSSGMFKEWVKNPLFYKMKIDGLISSVDRLAYYFGSACHKFVLEGQEFDKEYLISDGLINEKTGKPFGRDTIKQSDFFAGCTKKVISNDDFNKICLMKSNILSHEEAKKLLISGEPERVLRVEVHGVMLQIRMDWFNEELGLVDLKTCSDLNSFSYDFKVYDYAIQMAFYAFVIFIATGIFVPCFIIATEKNETAGCAVFKIDADCLVQKMNWVGHQIQKFAQQKASGSFNRGFDDLQFLTDF